MLGKFFFRQSVRGGFGKKYRSFRYKVTLHHSWTSSEENAQSMVSEWNSRILGGLGQASAGVEGRLEDTARIIATTRRTASL